MWQLPGRLTGRAAYQSRATLFPSQLALTRLSAQEGVTRLSVAEMGFRTRVLNYSTVRELLRDGRMSLGRPLDLDDPRQLSAAYDEVVGSVRVAAHWEGAIEVVYRGPDPAVNASVLRALLRSFVGEDERERQEQARVDLKCYRDKLADARTALAVVDNELREFNIAHPWLPDELAELDEELRQAEEERQRATGEVRALDASKRVSEWRARRASGPELLAARRLLHEKRTAAADVVSQYNAAVSAVVREDDFWPCRGCRHSSIFRVAEWPSLEPTRATPLRDELLRVQGVAFILALAFLLVLSPVWFRLLIRPA